MDFIEASFTMVTVYQTAEVRQQKLFHASLQISKHLIYPSFPQTSVFYSYVAVFLSRNISINILSCDIRILHRFHCLRILSLMDRVCT